MLFWNKIIGLLWIPNYDIQFLSSNNFQQVFFLIKFNQGWLEEFRVQEISLLSSSISGNYIACPFLGMCLLKVFTSFIHLEYLEEYTLGQSFCLQSVIIFYAFDLS